MTVALLSKYIDTYTAHRQPHWYGLVAGSCLFYSLLIPVKVLTLLHCYSNHTSSHLLHLSALHFHFSIPFPSFSLLLALCLTLFWNLFLGGKKAADYTSEFSYPWIRWTCWRWWTRWRSSKNSAPASRTAAWGFPPTSMDTTMAPVHQSTVLSQAPPCRSWPMST